MYVGRGSGKLLEHVKVLFTAGSAVGLTDRELLERFLVDGRESAEAAFTALVERHGPMVLRVCHQALGDPHAAEDAFQATFLVLARQAASIRRRDSLESWLFGVASRAAARIRMMEARRRRLERRRAFVRAHRESDVPDASERWPELHVEIARLPAKYRAPILLCYFEGRTHEQAAAQLGWPVGTVKTRLARAREQLRWRLESRGCSSALLMPVTYLRPSSVSQVSRILLDTTARAAVGFASRTGAAEICCVSVVEISQGVLKAMLINKLRLAAITLIGAGAVGLTTLVLARQFIGTPQGDGQPFRLPAPALEPPLPLVLSLIGSTDFEPEALVRVHAPFDCRVDKVLVDLGSKVRKGDPLLELFSADLAGAKSNYEAAMVRWVRGKRVLDSKIRLYSESRIARKELFEAARKELFEAKNDEAQSLLKMKHAKVKLFSYGLTEAEIENAKNEDGIRKANMILRSQADGFVVQRNVVSGNSYASRDTLVAIAAIDTLSVRANIDHRDAAKLEVGQRATVTLPFQNQAVSTTLKFIGLEAHTGKVYIRASVPNHGHRLKAGLLVRLDVEFGPKALATKATDFPAHQNSSVNVQDRLSEVERSLERVLAEIEGRPPNEEVLRRLRQLEGKLDHALNVGTGK